MCRSGASKGAPGDAECVTEILGAKNEAREQNLVDAYPKCYKTHLQASLIPNFSRGDISDPLKRAEGERRGWRMDAHPLVWVALDLSA